MRAEIVFLTMLLVIIALTLCSCSPQEIAEVDVHTKDMLVVYTTPQSEPPQMINTFTQAEKTEIINPYFSLQNTTTELFRVDHAGNFYLYPLTTCGKLYTDGNGLLTCGTDANTNCSVANSCPAIVYSGNTTWITSNQGYNTTAQIFNAVNNNTFLKTETVWLADKPYYINSTNTSWITTNQAFNTTAQMFNAIDNYTFVKFTNISWITANQGYNTTAQIFAVANNGTFLKTYTNLTEDDVEGYIFDSDNTANLDMNNYNITVNTIIMENDQPNHWIYDNSTCIVMKAGTTYFEVCE